MRSDQVFVLLLIILIPMTGCFDNSVGDAEGAQDSDSSSDSTGDSTNTPSSNSAQARTWYSSGGVSKIAWSDGQYTGYYSVDGDVYMGTSYVDYGSDDDYRYRQISDGSSRCIDRGPFYNSSTGEYLGERCNEWGNPDSASDWNLSDCILNGGEVIWEESYYGGYNYGNAPDCRMSFAEINLTAGQALMIYEWSGFSIASTCDGVDVYTSNPLSNKEYVIAPGSALECTHELYRTLSYTATEGSSDLQSIWSIVYAIQDTTVV